MVPTPLCRPTIKMQANCYPSVFKNWLRLWSWFWFESNFAGPQSPDFGRWAVAFFKRLQLKIR
jgi:hypothetical protein